MYYIFRMLLASFIILSFATHANAKEFIIEKGINISISNYSYMYDKQHHCRDVVKSFTGVSNLYQVRDMYRNAEAINVNNKATMITHNNKNFYFFNTKQSCERFRNALKYSHNKSSWKTRTLLIKKLFAETNQIELYDIGIIYPLDTFMVKLKNNTGRKHLKVGLSLEIKGEDLTSELDKKKSIIKDKIIRILSSYTAEEVSSRKVKVKEQIIDTLNIMIQNGRVRNAYFTEFVVK